MEQDGTRQSNIALEGRSPQTLYIHSCLIGAMMSLSILCKRSSYRWYDRATDKPKISFHSNQQLCGKRASQNTPRLVQARQKQAGLDHLVRFDFSVMQGRNVVVQQKGKRSLSGKFCTCICRFHLLLLLIKHMSIADN